jgi:hypothetical protein
VQACNQPIRTSKATVRNVGRLRLRRHDVFGGWLHASTIREFTQVDNMAPKTTSNATSKQSIGMYISGAKERTARRSSDQSMLHRSTGSEGRLCIVMLRSPRCRQNTEFARHETMCLYCMLYIIGVLVVPKLHRCFASWMIRTGYQTPIPYLSLNLYICRMFSSIVVCPSKMML